MNIAFLLFEDFETLDLMGPCEVFGFVDGAHLRYFSVAGGPVKAKQGYDVLTEPLSAMEKDSVLVVPGGMGTRALVGDEDFLAALKNAAEGASYVLTVCTGSAILARTCLLDSLAATSNKRAFAWVAAQGPAVRWQPSARWVADGRFYTASGVSAGTDMALGFVADRIGQKEAERIAKVMEYIWNDDQNNDPFAFKGEL
ncbi:MAG TPA: DJ-1/PfpI family protein [Terriglobales bacterium]|nr:DJ-1/PfpI family protein [Terriglobales bacterium]